MKLILTRIYTCYNYTIGNLYMFNPVTGEKEYICDVLEDSDRMLDQEMPLEKIKSLKIKCRTAIPSGSYKVTLNIKSPSFSKKKYYSDFCNGYLPRLIDVPGFSGILIHRGVDEDNSCGCLLVGYNKIRGKLVDSKEAFEKLMTDYLIPNKNENITIEINRIYK